MLVFLFATLFVMAGCTGGGSSRRNASAEELVGRPQVGVLQLPRGPSTGRFKITALSPPQHTWDVQVVAPATADVGVRIRTWYGQPLNVLDSTRERTSCKVRNGRSTCVSHLPRLEAQLAGAWTVIVSKRSTPPATVRVAVTFNKG